MGHAVSDYLIMSTTYLLNLHFHILLFVFFCVVVEDKSLASSLLINQKQVVSYIIRVMSCEISDCVFAKAKCKVCIGPMRQCFVKFCHVQYTCCMQNSIGSLFD